MTMSTYYMKRSRSEHVYDMIISEPKYFLWLIYIRPKVIYGYIGTLIWNDYNLKASWEASYIHVFS